MPSDTAEGTGPPTFMGPGVGTDAGGAWTSFDDVRGWQMPFKTKGFAATKKINMYVPTGLIIGFTIGIVVVLPFFSTAMNMLLIPVIVVVIVSMMAMTIPLVHMTRQMADQFENLIRDVDLSPEDAIARVESVLIAVRMPFTRLSKEDPDRYWKDEYSETFIVSGGRAHVRVYDEQPSGMGKGTKVYVGPAKVESEPLVSTLAWHLDKALPDRNPL